MRRLSNTFRYVLELVQALGTGWQRAIKQRVAHPAVNVRVLVSRETSAREAETVAVPFSTQAIATVIPLPPAQPDPEPQSSLDRTEQVQQLLGVAWGLGFNTYPQLIEYVRGQTGQGCSRRAIAQFKQRQGLL